MRLRVPLSLLAALLLIPSAASANTLTVDPADANNACTRGSDETCKTVGQAVAAAEAKDTIEIKAGTYAEAVTIPAAKSELVIKGLKGADGKLPSIAGTGTGDTLVVQAPKTSIESLTVEAPGKGASAIQIDAADAKLTGVSAQRAQATDVDAPAVDITVGPATLQHVFAVQGQGPAETLTGGVRSSAPQSVTINDSVVISAKGDGIILAAGNANKIVRSSSVAPVGSSDGLQVTSASASAEDKKVTIDSSILMGGPTGAGLRAETLGAELPTSNAGDITIDARHITIAGSGSGIVLDGTAATSNGLTGQPVGNITATFTDSIIHGPSNKVDQAASIPIVQTGNTASVTYKNVDGKPVVSTTGAKIQGAPVSDTADNALFIDPAKANFALRADAPLQDKGGAPAADESDKDVHGEPRVVDGADADATAASDLGADEFVNRNPTAIFGATNRNPAQNTDVGFISGSTDPEQATGGGIVEWRWDFGDGQKQTTNVGGVTHKYATIGTYNVTLQVVDRQGGVSAVSAPIAISVKDGTAPKTTIASPTNRQSLTLLKQTRKVKDKKTGRTTTKTVRKARPLTVIGTATDEGGVSTVRVALRLKSRSKKKASTAQSTRTCEFLSGRSFVKRACDKPVFRNATLSGTTWTYRTPKTAKLVGGLYEVWVQATDNRSVSTTGFKAADGTLVGFRIK